MDYKYFLKNDIELLKSIDNKNLIINDENKYNFVYFCQSASTEQINTLLDEEGINILLNSSDLYTKLNGLITCDRDFDCLKNEHLCEKIVQLLDFNYIYGLKNNSAVDFYLFMKKNDPSRLIDLYSRYLADSQIHLLYNIDFTHSEINKLLPYSKKETAEFMVKNYDIILNNISYNELLQIADKKIKIPINCVSNKLINNIATINNVKTYRNLVDKLSYCFDVSYIENVRKKYYDEQLSTLDDGILRNYKYTLNDINNGGFLDEIVKKNHGNYVVDNELLLSLMKDSNENNIKRESDFKLSNIIIDYLFEDVPTNVIININNLLEFQQGEGKTLNDDEINLYSKIASIDKMNYEEKLELFNSIKHIDLKKKFYFDYANAKDKMVELFNSKMLNKDNVLKYKNDEMSNEAGVDIYYLNGENFMTLIKSLHETKDEILEGNIFKFNVDGSSFSIDGSSKLNTFKDPRQYYNIAYNNIPIHQLIHTFPVDSFSKYIRNNKGLPERDATDRINKLMTPEDFVLSSNQYNELIISVKNNNRIDEYNSMLKNPKPFAIYCYDTITENDIKTAKKYNLGIILVNTKKYNINKENKLNVFDTMGMVGDNPYNYVSEYDNERKVRF